MIREQKPNVLFLCTGNSCRSQMAEGLLREFAGNQLNVFSAGTDPAAKVHPLAIQVMNEIGIDISHQEPKGVKEYLGKLAVNQLFIVCQNVESECPRIYPFALRRATWPFDDPAAFVGSPTATLEQFRLIRDQIAARIKAWLIEIDQVAGIK